jgi:hypothetical protein
MDEIFNNAYGHPLFNTPFSQRHIINADCTASRFIYKPIQEQLQKNVFPFYNNTHSNAFTGQLMRSYIKQSKDTIIDDIIACGGKYEYNVMLVSLYSYQSVCCYFFVVK